MSAVSVPPSPFKGLSPFGDTEVDAAFFFGRVRETEVIAANLQASRLTVLYGPTGVGKSSILRAGVANRLRREPNTAVEILDAWSGDAAPVLRSLLAAARDDADVYLILDQFEEYFVYHGGERELPRLLADVVADRGRRVNLLIGIREDALARLDAFRAPIPNLLANRLRLERLDREAGRAAVLGPVESYNGVTGAHVDVEPALVEAVLDEVAVGRVELGGGGRGKPGGKPEPDRVEAPYLQLVMERLWQAERESGSVALRLDTLRRLGGSAQIVHDHLERAMTSLSPREQEAAAAMYNHLVTPSGTKIAHRVGDLAGYASVDERAASAVLEKLVQERIVRASSANGPASARYEIFHDVLADAVLSWRARHEERRALRAANEARRRARVVAGAAVAGLVIVAAIAVFALLERSHARSDATRARAGELVAQARSDLDADPRQSLALTLHAAQVQSSPQVEDALRDSLVALRVRRVIAAPNAVVAAASKGRILVGDATGRVRYLGTAGALKRSSRGREAVTSAALAQRRAVLGFPSGTVFDERHGSVHVRGFVTAVAARDQLTAAGTAKGGVTVWRSGAYRDRHRLNVRGRVNVLAFSLGGRFLLIVSRDRRARIADPQTGRIVHTLTQRGYINAAAFSPTGAVVATGSQDKTAKIWDASSGRALHVLGPANGGVTAVAFSPNGKLVAVASEDAVARVYDVATGTARFYLSGDTNAITDIGFNPQGTALVTASADRTARIWTTDVGRQLVVLRGHTDTVTRAFFTGAGRRVVTVGDDKTVRVWDPGTEPELRVLIRQNTPFTRAERRADGTIAITDATGRTRVLDARARQTTRTARGAPARAAAMSARRGDLEAQAESGLVTVARRGKIVARFHANVDALEFSPDGRLLAGGGTDRYLRVWDVRAGHQLYAFIAHQGPVRDVSFSPDGRWIVTAGPISVGIWRAADGRQILVLRGPTKPVRAALFTRDGRTVVTAGSDGTIRTYQCVVCATLPQLVRLAQRRIDETRTR